MLKEKEMMERNLRISAIALFLSLADTMNTVVVGDDAKAVKELVKEFQLPIRLTDGAAELIGLCTKDCTGVAPMLFLRTVKDVPRQKWGNVDCAVVLDVFSKWDSGNYPTSEDILEYFGNDKSKISDKSYWYKFLDLEMPDNEEKKIS